MLMTVLTASTLDQSELVEIQRQSCMKHGITPERYIAVPIADSYPKHPSWFRIRALLDHLAHHDKILWMDTDAMMLKPCDFRIAPNTTVAMARDHNGWNHGVAIWNNTPESREFLWRIYDSYSRYAQHEWHEQAAIHVLAEQMRVVEMQKCIFNAYEHEVTDKTCILHLPARSKEDRLRIMRSYLNKS